MRRRSLASRSNLASRRPKRPTTLQSPRAAASARRRVRRRMTATRLRRSTILPATQARRCAILQIGSCCPAPGGPGRRWRVSHPGKAGGASAGGPGGASAWRGGGTGLASALGPGGPGAEDALAPGCPGLAGRTWRGGGGTTLGGIDVQRTGAECSSWGRVQSGAASQNGSGRPRTAKDLSQNGYGASTD